MINDPVERELERLLDLDGLIVERRDQRLRHLQRTIVGTVTGRFAEGLLDDDAAYTNTGAVPRGRVGVVLLEPLLPLRTHDLADDTERRPHLLLRLLAGAVARSQQLAVAVNLEGRVEGVAGYEVPLTIPAAVVALNVTFVSPRAFSEPASGL